MHAKLEGGGYGVDSAPTAAANAIYYTGPLNIVPLEQQVVERPVVRTDTAKERHLPFGAHVSVSFSVELQGSGTAGTPPAFGPILRACGMAETITAGSSVSYVPAMVPDESVTIYGWQGDVRQIVRGWRGTWALEGQAGQAPTLRFEGKGLYAAPTDTVLPGGNVFTAFRPPFVVANTTTNLDFGGTLYELERFSMSLGAQIEFRNRPGYLGVYQTDRTSRGELSIGMTSAATLNVPALAALGDPTALFLQHGNTAGLTCVVQAPVCQVVTPTYGESQGRRLVNFGIVPRPHATAADLALTFS
jgi:hypothetical protein